MEVEEKIQAHVLSIWRESRGFSVVKAEKEC